MRTITKKIETDGKTDDYPIPKEWDKILTITLDGQEMEYSIVKEGSKRILRPNYPTKAGQVISAHVALKDTV